MAENISLGLHTAFEKRNTLNIKIDEIKGFNKCYYESKEISLITLI